MWGEWVTVANTCTMPNAPDLNITITTVGAPQVVNRVPVSFKNFHLAASGITFKATTLTTTNTVNTNAIKLFLNGVDVSAGLVISGPATNRARWGQSTAGAPPAD